MLFEQARQPRHIETRVLLGEPPLRFAAATERAQAALPVLGDEIRHLDWRAYARSDRYYIKLYEQETNLRATLVLDTSASMATPMAV